MSITERLANLSPLTVIITVVVLLVLRFALLKLKNPIAKSIAEIAESLAVAMALVFLLIRPFVVQAFYIPSASMHPTLLEQDHILVNKFIYRIRDPRLGDVVVFKAPMNATPDVMQQIEADADARGLAGKERSDYIVNESKKREKDFIKRVIAVPGDVVRITPGYVLIGDIQYSHADLRSQLSDMAREDGDHKVKLEGSNVYVDGRKISNSEVAAAFNDPNAKVKVVPAKVYINGKALNEPYIAEDPDDAYPGGRSLVDPKWIVTEKVGKQRVQEVKIPKGKLLVMGDNRNDSNDARFWGLLSRDRVLGKAMFIFWPLDRITWIH
ncbi:MAG: signal peptidase I [Armatimonadota bacterium]|nr:signal peptidase I [bacterium]